MNLSDNITYVSLYIKNDMYIFITLIFMMH